MDIPEKKAQKLTKWYLSALLAIVALVVLFSGDGTYFYRSGAIHLLGLIYVMLAAIRVFGRYQLHDPVLSSFLRKTLFAAGLFMTAEILELVRPYLQMSESLPVTRANLQLMGLLLLSFSAEVLVQQASGARGNRRNRKLPHLFSPYVLLALVAFSALLLVSENVLTFSVGSPEFIFYLLMALAVTMHGFTRFRAIGERLPVLKAFSIDMDDAYLLLSLSTMFILFQDALHEAIGLPVHTIYYLSYFTLFGGLSLMFYSFGEMKRLSGLYAKLAGLIKK